MLAALSLMAATGEAQDAAAPAKGLINVIGTVTAVDTAAPTITVKEDKTGTERIIQLANTRTLIKVSPGAKDLKSGTRITADDLQPGDRVDVRGTPAGDTPNSIAARAVILMSARDLQSARQAQAAAWLHSTSGVVNSIDPSAEKLTITTRTPEGPKPLIVETSKQTQFTRYSPQTPAVPVPSSFSDIQPGDQVRIIGNRSADNSSITATRLYSGAFRAVSGTIVSIAPDAKSLTIKSLANKQPVQVTLNDASAVRKLPPQLAMALARRLNPSARGETGDANASAGGQGRPPATGANNATSGGPASAPGIGLRTRGNGDISQIIERLPSEPVSGLKPGDAVVVAGIATGTDNRQLLATNIIAGVEPILQSAPAREAGASLGGDWGLGEIAAPQ
ncbi:MAG: hypothetical protein JO319_18075 [Acidobacteriaceae bacterium]|nr:hypothetical protein [Acidobacteriaceae bacterium]